MASTATQKDVAREAGVSQATVSLVLSNADASAIPAETIKRVHRAASALGYLPNRFAQALRTSRTRMIACVIPDITNPFYPSLVRGVQSFAEAANYDVMTLNTDGLKERELHFLKMAQQGRVDGLIGVFFHLRTTDLKPLLEAGTPVVRLEASAKRGGALPIENVYVDNQAASTRITEFLLQRGHRNIAMIAGRGGPETFRVKGYRAALQSAGLESHVILDDEFNEQGGTRTTETVIAMRKEHDISAIVAANDLMAIGAMHALHTQRIRIPEDMALVGFDDIPFSRLLTPPLTTISLSQREMGIEAARKLLARLDGTATGPGKNHQLPFKIVERGTS